MKTIDVTNRCKKDIARCARRGFKKERFDRIIDMLENDAILPAACRPHLLSGNWAGHTECHIRPDWLLIYKVDGDSIILVATGTHADLF